MKITTSTIVTYSVQIEEPYKKSTWEWVPWTCYLYSNVGVGNSHLISIIPKEQIPSLQEIKEFLEKALAKNTQCQQITHSLLRHLREFLREHKEHIARNFCKRCYVYGQPVTDQYRGRCADCSLPICAQHAKAHENVPIAYILCQHEFDDCENRYKSKVPTTLSTLSS